MNFVYSVGDAVHEKTYGNGVVAGIDESSKDFTYLVKFSNHGVAWLPEWRLKPAVKSAN